MWPQSCKQEEVIISIVKTDAIPIIVLDNKHEVVSIYCLIFNKNSIELARSYWVIQ